MNDNAWAGIFHEISYEAIIRNNTVFENGNKKSYYHGSQILVANSCGAEVHHTVDGRQLSGNSKVGGLFCIFTPYSVSAGNIGKE